MVLGLKKGFERHFWQPWFYESTLCGNVWLVVKLHLAVKLKRSRSACGPSIFKRKGKPINLEIEYQLDFQTGIFAFMKAWNWDFNIVSQMRSQNIIQPEVVQWKSMATLVILGRRLASSCWLWFVEYYSALSDNLRLCKMWDPSYWRGSRNAFAEQTPCT